MSLNANIRLYYHTNRLTVIMQINAEFALNRWSTITVALIFFLANFASYKQ